MEDNHAFVGLANRCLRLLGQHSVFLPFTYRAFAFIVIDFSRQETTAFVTLIFLDANKLTVFTNVISILSKL